MSCILEGLSDMITFMTGDIFQGEHEVLVNDINCAGKMDIGMGIILKDKYPNMFRQYEKLCASKIIRPGNTWVYETSRDIPKYIFNAATQYHWKDRADLDWVIKCYQSIVSNIVSRKVTDIAVPPLGCGAGGLRWKIVRQYAEKALDGDPYVKNHCRVVCYESEE